MPRHLPGHSRKEGEGTRMEDGACDPFLSEDIFPSHSYLKWTHLLPQSAGTGGHLLCARICARGYCAPIKIPALPSPHRQRTPNKSTLMHDYAHAWQASVLQHHRYLQTGHYIWSLCVGCEGGTIQLELRPRSWKGASQPRTLERASQAVEKAQDERRRREHGVPRNREGEAVPAAAL